MSGLVLVWRRGGGSLAPDVLDASMHALRHRGLDGRGTFQEDGFALGRQHFRSLPQSEEAGPLIDRVSRTALLFDGRLDERDALCDVLGAQERISDAALAHRALLRWGRDALSRFYGSWALAFCDLRSRRVLIARDALGNRTLFYRLPEDHEDLAVVASEPIAVRAVRREGESSKISFATLDAARLATYFAVAELADDRTFFADVRELLPGSSLEIDAESAVRGRHWTFDPTPCPPASAEEDAERFVELLDRAVKARLRVGGSDKPAALLSGGLDSSSVVALAARRLGPAGLRTVTWGFENFPECDERHWARKTLGAWPCDALEIPGDDDLPLRDAEKWPLDPSTPESNPFTRLFIRTWDTASDAGSRVVLHGGFADHLYNGADRWRPDRGLQDLWWFLRRRGLRELWRRGLRPALRRRWKGAPLISLPTWLTPEARALVQRSIGPPEIDLCRRPLQGLRVLGLLTAHSATANHGIHHRCRMELRSPYRDLRLAEFMLRTPPDRLYHRGLYKRVAREALRGILPDEVLEPRRPVSLTPLYRSGLAERQVWIRELLEEAREELTDFVRADWLATASHRDLDGRESVAFWLCLSYALWRRR